MLFLINNPTETNVRWVQKSEGKGYDQKDVDQSWYYNLIKSVAKD